MSPMRPLLSLCSLALVACGAGPNANSGGDSSRGEALPAVLDTLAYDRVSALDGDATDWKSFKLDQAAAITLTIFWDDPAAISAKIELRDQFGALIADRKHKRGTSPETLGPQDLAEGTYFLSIVAEDGASVYSYELTTGFSKKRGSGPDL